MQIDLSESNYPLTPQNHSKATEPERSFLGDRFNSILAFNEDSYSLPSDWQNLLDPFASTLMGLPFSVAGTYSESTQIGLDLINANFQKLLPTFGGVRIAPPDENFDPRIELERLNRINQKVLAMDEAGEFDKAVDAFIGIHGLKKELTTKQRTELKDRFMAITTISLLEQEWKNAYVNSISKIIDISFDALRDFLFSDDRSVRRIPENEMLKHGGPDLLSFINEPRWKNWQPKISQDVSMIQYNIEIRDLVRFHHEKHLNAE